MPKMMLQSKRGIRMAVLGGIWSGSSVVLSLPTPIRTFVATSPTTTTVPELSLWHTAVAPIPRIDILPIGMGNVDHRANIAAFFGDQTIVYHVGKELRRRGFAPQGVGWLTMVTGQAVSNEQFALHFQTILPVQSAGLEQGSTRDCGTMVEAAVDAVQDEAAVTELATWLLNHSLEMGDRNVKGRLLELGGKVTTTKKPNTKDHAPVFKAVASLQNKRAVAHGRTKVEAEQAAASKLEIEVMNADESSNRENTVSGGNTKGRLLHMGGTVQCKRDPTTPDHQPSFIAIATIGSDTVKRKGPTKAKAEQRAAEELLTRFST